MTEEQEWALYPGASTRQCNDLMQAMKVTMADGVISEAERKLG